jgi:UDP-N-acetyl-D-galactosamine dehydrogenase
VEVHDPWADSEDVLREYGIHLLSSFHALDLKKYVGCLVAVGHEEFKTIPFGEYNKNGFVLYDVKGILPKADKRL